MMSAKKISNSIKSLTAREIFRLHTEVKRFLWGGKFWTSGYYINTVGQYVNEEVIKKYVFKDKEILTAMKGYIFHNWSYFDTSYACIEVVHYNINISRVFSYITNM